jgi:hypothetical protein
MGGARGDPTLGATSTNDELLEGDALIKGLTLSTFEFQNEYDWQFVLI